MDIHGMTSVGVLLAALGALVGVVLALRSDWRDGRTLLLVMLAPIGLVSVGIFFLTPEFQRGEPNRRIQISSSLKSYSFGWMLYKEDHGARPPLGSWEDSLTPFLMRKQESPVRIGLNPDYDERTVGAFLFAPTLRPGPNALLRDDADLAATKTNLLTTDGESVLRRTPPSTVLWKTGRSVNFSRTTPIPPWEDPWRAARYGIAAGTVLFVALLGRRALIDKERRTMWLALAGILVGSMVIAAIFAPTVSAS